MENASKALLIAGAILLVIAIIAIAMSILNQGQEVTNRVSGQFNTLTIQSHNSQFTQYTQLQRMTKTQLIDLVAKVKSSNNENFALEGSFDNPFTVCLKYGEKEDKIGTNGASMKYDGCDAATTAGVASGNAFFACVPTLSDAGIIVALTVTPVSNTNAGQNPNSPNNNNNNS